MDFDYKKYSLENLENWMHDALSSAEATPQEIYDVIKGVVDENYHMHKVHANRCYELLALLNGNGKGHIKEYDDYVNSDKKSLSCDKDDTSPECKSAWNSFWDSYQGSTVSSVQYTEEELDAMCNKAEYEDAIKNGWSMTADGFWIKENKSKKWILPTNVDKLTGECYVNFPNDLLEDANLKEGDKVEWVDNKNGSYTIRKVIESKE